MRSPSREFPPRKTHPRNKRDASRLDSRLDTFDVMHLMPIFTSRDGKIVLDMNAYFAFLRYSRQKAAEKLDEDKK